MRGHRMNVGPAEEASLPQVGIAGGFRYGPTYCPPFTTAPRVGIAGNSPAAAPPPARKREGSAPNNVPSRPRNSYCHPGTRRASCTCPPRISTEPLPLFFKRKPQHAGHLPNYVEMIWYHAIPDSSVVLLLVLLFFSPFGPLKGCKFDYSPIATSDFSQDIKPLKEYLLLDYKVSMPFSLKQDIFCSELWNLHFINENLKKLINVSGERLKKLIKKIYNHTKVVESCNIEVDNSSVSFALTNISQFVDVIPFHLQSLSAKIEKITSEEKCADFKNCTVIQSQIGQSLSVLQNLLSYLSTLLIGS